MNRKRLVLLWMQWKQDSQLHGLNVKDHGLCCCAMVV